MAKLFCEFNGRKVEGMELEQDGSIDVQAICEIQAKLIYLCSPNNPTGLSIPINQIKSILEKSNAFVVVDEAYAEFSDQDALDLLKSFPNLIVIRTFSKLHAFAVCVGLV
jgi:histidinol-phosphate aminotransferase